MGRTGSIASLVAGVGVAALCATAIGGAQAPTAPAAAGQGAGAARGAGGGGGAAPAAASPNPMLFEAFDADHDGLGTRQEFRNAFAAWYDKADAAKTGSVTLEQLGAVLNSVVAPGAPAVPPAAAPAAPPAAARGGAAGAGGRGAGGGAAPDPVWGTSAPTLTEPCGGRSQTPTVACPQHVAAMMAALPATAPAKPAQPRKVLIWSRLPSSGYQHSSIPLAAKTIEELGKKTGAWTSVTSWDPGVFTADNLKQYDAIFMSNTTGSFLDKAGDQATTDARRKALVDFVRGGKGIAGVHATGDSYRAGGGGGRGGGATGPGGSLAGILLRWSWGLDDKKLVNNVQTMTKADMDKVANAWFDAVDPGKAGKVSVSDFMARAIYLTNTGGGSNSPYIGPAGRDGARGGWQDWNSMIGGFFKYHWNDGQLITVKIDDPKSPITASFKGQEFEVVDEIYTFGMDTYSRKNLHILTSINYDKMNLTDRLKESNPRADHDYGLSWIHKDGQGRVFYHALGHNERIYAIKPILESILAGMQYVIGDLKADDSPSQK